MTLICAESASATVRVSRPREYVMTRPDFFGVSYAINPWMNPNEPVDVDLALSQWRSLRDLYVSLGPRVATVDPVPGLPDMVFAANGLLSVNGWAFGARFAYVERRAEARAYAARLEACGQRVHPAANVNEGEGDFLVVGDRVLAGSGFRTVPAAHAELAEVSGLDVVSLRLVDPRYYHLDTALFPLSDTEIAYFPAAFTESSREVLEELYPGAVIAAADDAAVLGLNSVSDGRHVVMTDRAPALAAQLRERGFEPIGVDLSELLKGGGGVKCCTMELHQTPEHRAHPDSGAGR